VTAVIAPSPVVAAFWSIGKAQPKAVPLIVAYHASPTDFAPSVAVLYNILDIFSN